MNCPYCGKEKGNNMKKTVTVLVLAVFGAAFILLGTIWLHIPLGHILINLLMIYSVPALSLLRKYIGRTKLLLIQIVVILVCSIFSYRTNGNIEIINVVLIGACVASYPISEYIKYRKNAE